MERRRGRLRGLIGPALLVPLAGCGLADAPILDPKGPITEAERDLLFETVAIMMIVVVPVWIMTAWFGRRFRASNDKAEYRPDWYSSIRVEVIVWLVPAAIIVTLGTYVWESTHRLDPFQPLAVEGEPVRVRVVAQDWKWLFLYPDEGIATVNELGFVAGRPLSLELTSDTVMNSFLIPALGSQIYAMAGMTSKLNLLADEPGTFTGRNVQFSGDGFDDQRFDAIAMTGDGFEDWVATVRQEGTALDATAYAALVKPSDAHPVTYYATYENGLFDRILAKYAANDDGGHGAAETE